MIFTWIPSYGSQRAHKPRFLEVRFGDGYSQRGADGLNANPQSWQLIFEARRDAEAKAILDFLHIHRDGAPFHWVPPDQTVALRFICREYSRGFSDAGINQITATFEQDFNP